MAKRRDPKVPSDMEHASRGKAKGSAKGKAKAPPDPKRLASKKPGPRQDSGERWLM